MSSSTWSIYMTYFSLSLPLPQKKKNCILVSLPLLTDAPSLRFLPFFTDYADTIVYTLCSKQDHSHDSLKQNKQNSKHSRKKKLLEYNWKPAQQAAQKPDWVTGNARNWYCQSPQLMKLQPQIIHELFWIIWRFLSVTKLTFQGLIFHKTQNWVLYMSF